MEKAYQINWWGIYEFILWLLNISEYSLVSLYIWAQFETFFRSLLELMWDYYDFWQEKHLRSKRNLKNKENFYFFYSNVNIESLTLSSAEQDPTDEQDRKHLRAAPVQQFISLQCLRGNKDWSFSPSTQTSHFCLTGYDNWGKLADWAIVLRNSIKNKHFVEIKSISVCKNNVDHSSKSE